VHILADLRAPLRGLFPQQRAPCDPCYPQILLEELRFMSFLSEFKLNLFNHSLHGQIDCELHHASIFLSFNLFVVLWPLFFGHWHKFIIEREDALISLNLNIFAIDARRTATWGVFVIL